MAFIPEVGWSTLDYWNCGEWQVVQEKYDEMVTAKKSFNPARSDVFAALDSTPFASVRVAIIGQDPYPNPALSTGTAFSTPKGVKTIPPTLRNVFNEYKTDLGYPEPKSGDLSSWLREGVLLWNVYPTCESWKSASHRWTEYTFLTKEIVQRLSNKNIVFVLLGQIAHSYSQYIDGETNATISLSHPSPLSASRGLRPFIGSRVFTTVNDLLCSELKLSPIDWRLP